MAINEVPAFSKCTNSTMTSQMGKMKTRKGKGREFLSLRWVKGYICMNRQGHCLSWIHAA